MKVKKGGKALIIKKFKDKKKLNSLKLKFWNLMKFIKVLILNLLKKKHINIIEIE